MRKENFCSDLDAWRFDRNSPLLSRWAALPEHFPRPFRRDDSDPRQSMDGRLRRARDTAQSIEAAFKGEPTVCQAYQVYEKKERIEAVSLVQE